MGEQPAVIDGRTSIDPKLQEYYDTCKWIDRLEELVKITNPDSDQYVDLERPHQEADSILCEIISKYIQNGKLIVDTYNKIDKWYA